MTSDISPEYKFGNCDYFDELKKHAILWVSKARLREAGFEGEDHFAWKSSLLYLSIKDNGLFDVANKIFTNMNIDIVNARIMVLEVSGRISKHRDSFLKNDIARLHIPIVTNNDVKFYIDDFQLKWREGEVWYGDFRREHWGENSGTEDRIHMVFDVVVNEKLMQYFNNDIRFNTYFGALSDTVSNLSLKNYETKFVIPKGLELFKVINRPLSRDMLASIRACKNNLTLYLDDSPFLPLKAVSASSLEIEGLPIKVTIDYDYTNRRETHATLRIIELGQEIALEKL